MYIGYHIGTGEVEHVVVAAQGTLTGNITLSAEIVFAETIALYHRSHGTIEDEDALGGYL